MEPPGNRIGVTTKASVVRASRWVPIVSSPASESCSRAGLASSGTMRPSTSALLALPPAPCAIVMRSSRKRCGRRRISSMRSATRSSESWVTGESRSTSRPRASAAAWRTGRSCNRPRRHPPTRTMHVPIGVSGVQAVPKTLHSQGFMAPLSTSPHWQALGSSTRKPRDLIAEFGIEGGVLTRELQRRVGMDPSPRHSKKGRGSKTSASTFSAAGFPS